LTSRRGRVGSVVESSIRRSRRAIWRRKSSSVPKTTLQAVLRVRTSISPSEARRADRDDLPGAVEVLGLELGAQASRSATAPCRRSGQDRSGRASRTPSSHGSVAATIAGSKSVPSKADPVPGDEEHRAGRAPSRLGHQPRDRRPLRDAHGERSGKFRIDRGGARPGGPPHLRAQLAQVEAHERRVVGDRERPRGASSCPGRRRSRAPGCADRGRTSPALGTRIGPLAEDVRRSPRPPRPGPTITGRRGRRASKPIDRAGAAPRLDIARGLTCWGMSLQLRVSGSTWHGCLCSWAARGVTPSENAQPRAAPFP
jgi:hypothetical protein